LGSCLNVGVGQRGLESTSKSSGSPNRALA
jgi:hypothetical protein